MFIFQTNSGLYSLFTVINMPWYEDDMTSTVSYIKAKS